MPSLASLRLVGLLVAAGVLVASAVAVFHHYKRLEADSGAYTACRALAEGSAVPRPRTPCAASLAAAIDGFGAARACDAALQAGDAGGYARQRTCSAPVKELEAQVAALSAEVADRDRLVDQVTKDRNRDVASAEARAVAQTRKVINANAALEAAPRDPGGHILCGPECLRVLAGGAPAGGR